MGSDLIVLGVVVSTSEGLQCLGSDGFHQVVAWSEWLLACIASGGLHIGDGQ